MSTKAGPGAGGTTLSPLSASPGRALRAVAFTPAVRGYPGGIADMTAEQDDFTGGSFDGGGSLAGEPAAMVAAGTGQRDSAGPAFGTSVWQQSVAAWQEAGIDWLREARPGPSPEDRAAEDDLQHTEPIPVVPALDAPGQAGAPGPAAEPAADEDLIVLSAAKATAAEPASGQAGARAAEDAAAG